MKQAQTSISNSLVWFRRDLRNFDHASLYAALSQSQATYCVFVFDTTILNGLPQDDRRIGFIHQSVVELAQSLENMGGNLIVLTGDPRQEIPRLAAQLNVNAVFINRDYEPAAKLRDQTVATALASFNCTLIDAKDQVIFDRNEVLSLSNKPFSVFTPYKNAWLKYLLSDPSDFYFKSYPVEKYQHRLKVHQCAAIPSLTALGFIEAANLPLQGGMQAAKVLLEDFLSRIAQYGNTRDYPSIKGPSYLSVHLRFGTVSIRHLVREAMYHIRTGSAQSPDADGAKIWLSELIWRDFYFMILDHNPHVVDRAFKSAYDAIVWENGIEANENFAAWCEGRTGYPLVDAAMHQLNQTGYMHNRLRMVTACFLVKDLGIDWRRGEQYFALKLNDFDLSANNGGWQWAASTGCDAQPYFRIFNPITQSEKFDPEGKFIRRYLPQLAALDNKSIHAPWKISSPLLDKINLHLGSDYPLPIVDHDVARKQTLSRYAVVKKAP